MSANLRMTKSKARALSNISTTIGQVLFGAVIAAIVLPLDSGKILVVILELVLAIMAWIVTILFAEKGKL